jgi:predicted dehydrogenase
MDGLLGRPFHLRARISVDLVDYERLRSEIEPCPGGMFYYLGSHMVDLMTSVFGRPTRVTPTLRGDGDANRPYIDNTIVVFEFPRATAVIEAATLETSAFERRRFEIYGTKGSVIVEPFENPAPKVLLALDSDRDGYRAGWQPVEVGNQPRYVEDIAELLGRMAGQRSPIVSHEHDILAHETLLRACGVLGD